MQLLAVEEVHGQASHVLWQALACYVSINCYQCGHVHGQSQPVLRVV